MTDAIRGADERRADTLARLEGDDDIWVATASAGRPHLVPLSLAWDGTDVILATPAASPTAGNAAASGEVRLALGTSRDVTIIEAAAEVVPCADVPDPVADCYTARTGWDPGFRVTSVPGGSARVAIVCRRHPALRRAGIG